MDTNYLHGILLTPYSLDRYPYERVVCTNPDSTEKTVGERKFIQAMPVTAPSELLPFGKRKPGKLELAAGRLVYPHCEFSVWVWVGGNDPVRTVGPGACQERCHLFGPTGDPLVVDRFLFAQTLRNHAFDEKELK
ncbi:unnamed protein product [Echinostoma caproni]|uniref:Uncharacterized protein n=1 Tax=Echinostoma caproni TaxID=27848 RepID=A0A3P8I9M8_9TREM|nr:unnamed protein product [Echinostoma caproni]